MLPTYSYELRPHQRMSSTWWQLSCLPYCLGHLEEAPSRGYALDISHLLHNLGMLECVLVLPPRTVVDLRNKHHFHDSKHDLALLSHQVFCEKAESIIEFRLLGSFAKL